MPDWNVTFSRHFLTDVIATVKKHFPKTRPMKDAWVHKTGFRDHWEFHGPGDFYWHGHAANAYEARAEGWCAWLHKNGIDDEPEKEEF